MRLFSVALWGILMVSLCYAEDKTTEVVGTAECADCKKYNIKTSQAFPGLRVSIDCMMKNGVVKRIGDGELDNEGKFKVAVDGEVTEACYAQLHSAAALPCPFREGNEAAKIVLKSETSGRKTFAPAKTVQFSMALCASKTFLPPNYNFPPLPPLSGHPWYKTYPPLQPFPPLPPLSSHPWLKKFYPPPTPVITPLPPSIPEIPPTTPVIPPTPVYKKKPPVYKKKPPVYKKSPDYKKLPPVVKPLPPPVNLPCPPLPKLPPYFKHPKFGPFPPLPPIHS